MRRREFTAGLLFAAAPRAARARQRVTRYRIALFHPAIPATLLAETGGGAAWCANRRLIAGLTRKSRLPAMSPYRDYVDAAARLTE